jgi:hypothetical protein
VAAPPLPTSFTATSGNIPLIQLKTAAEKHFVVANGDD